MEVGRLRDSRDGFVSSRVMPNSAEDHGMSHPDEDALDWLGGGEPEEQPKPIQRAAKKPSAGTGKHPPTSRPPLNVPKPSGSTPKAPPAPAAHAAPHDGQPSDDVLAWLSGGAPGGGGDTIVSPAGKNAAQQGDPDGPQRRVVESLEELNWLEQERADSEAQGEDQSATPALIHEDEDEVPGAGPGAGESMFAAALDDFFSNIEDEAATATEEATEAAANTSMAGATLAGRQRRKSNKSASEGKVDKVIGTLIRYLTRKDPIKESQIDSIFKMTVGKLVDAMNAELLAVYFPIDEKQKLHIQGVYWSKGLWEKGEEQKYKREIENLTNKMLDPKVDIVGRAIEKKTSVTSLDAKKDPDFKNVIGAAAGIEIGPMLTVPIVSENDIFGAVQVMNKVANCGEEFFSYQDQKLLEEVAFYCAKIIQKVKDPTRTATEIEMARYVGRLAKTEVLDLSKNEIDWEDADLMKLWEVVGIDAIQKYMILPRKALNSRELSVIMVNPLDEARRRDFEAKTEKLITEAFVAMKSQIQGVLDKKFKKAAAALDTSDLGSLANEIESGDGAEKVELKAEDEKEDAAPIIKLANRIIEDAYARGASDIHIEPYEMETRVRYRVDGNLEQRMILPKKATNALISRIKIMSNLDIAERRMPQDGRIKFKQFSRTGLDLDLRVALGPMAFGEKCVMRLLLRNSISLGLDAMGFSPKNLELFRWASKQAYGMVLNVGPTGSGKTTTLYSALSEVNTIDVNIQTAEDPIEYPLNGINQMQMHKDIGLTFASALRCFLRMDPDIILVGEIRDLETAEIGIEAALTGHLLFSTLHTNDAAGTVTRFIEMGVEPFMVSSCLLLVCAQRLGRKLCKVCKVPYPDAPDEYKKILMQDDRPIKELFKTKETGCEKCGNSGYKGRVGIHEIFTMNEELRSLTNKSASSDVIKLASIRNGMKTLWMDALWKCKEGIMDLKEVMANVRADEDVKAG
jgi:type IV pilus assembly protein PilB